MAPNKSSAWIQTYTGKKFYPSFPSENDYDIIDIAHALSNACRFTGHCDRFYSVAQHSVFVSNFVSLENALWGLLHDASEAYICDIARPVKHIEEMSHYRIIEEKLQSSIVKAFGLPEQQPEEVKQFDALLLRAEADKLGLLTPEWHHFSLPKIKIDIRPEPPEVAEFLFLSRYCDLTNKLLIKNSKYYKCISKAA